MTERENPNHPSTEIRRYISHSHIADELHSAAGRLWRPSGQPDTYTYGTSAAGQELTSILPQARSVEEAQEGIRLSVAITNPSRRLRGALKEVMGETFVYGDHVQFVVIDPQEAGFTDYAGVRCLIFDHFTEQPQGDPKPPIRDFDMVYGTFEFLMEKGGICEKASVPQRMGRWAVNRIDDWLEAEITINKSGGRQGMDFRSPW